MSELRSCEKVEVAILGAVRKWRWPSCYITGCPLTREATVALSRAGYDVLCTSPVSIVLGWVDLFRLLSWQCTQDVIY